MAERQTAVCPPEIADQLLTETRELLMWVSAPPLSERAGYIARFFEPHLVMRRSFGSRIEGRAVRRHLHHSIIDAGQQPAQVVKLALLFEDHLIECLQVSLQMRDQQLQFYHLIGGCTRSRRSVGTNSRRVGHRQHQCSINLVYRAVPSRS